MADTEQPRRNRKGPRKSRFTDANPDQEEEERSDADRGPNVSSTESEDSDVEAVRKVQDMIRKKQQKSRAKDADVNDRDWGAAPKAPVRDKKSRRRRRRSSSSSGSSSSSSSSDDSRRRSKKKRRRRRHSSSSSSSSSSSRSSGSDSKSSVLTTDSEPERAKDKKKEKKKGSGSEGEPSDHSSDVEITGADVDLDEDVVITGASFEDLKKQTKKLAARFKTQERKRLYNKFFIRTAPEEIDLMSNETMEERDARTIFIQQIHHKVHARDLHEFFSAVGNVHEVNILSDEYGRRSKGMGYVEFGDVESVPLALGLSGQRILGVPIMVKLCQGDRNRASNTTAWTRNSRIEEQAKLAVGNLHPNMDEKMLRAIFEPFGKVTHIRVERDQITGESKGFAHVTFKSFDPSRRAMESLDGYNVGGHKLKIQLSSVGLDNTITEDIVEIDENCLNGPGANTGVRFRPRPQGVGAHASAQGWDEWVTGGIKKEEVKEEDKQFIDKRGMLIRKHVSAKFDVLEREEVDRGGISGMSRTEKVRLMAKLADGTDMELPQGAREVLDHAQKIKDNDRAQRMAAQQENNTPCFMIKNFFGLDDEDIKNAENDDEWTYNLSQDIIEETLDYGGLVHVQIDKKNKAGIVYMKAPTTYVANEIIQGLHGRYFSGRVLEAARIPLTNYNSLFPDSTGMDKVLQVDEE